MNLVGCNNSGTSNSNNLNNAETKNNQIISNENSNNFEEKNNENVNNSGTINNDNFNNNSKIAVDEAKEIALKHANLTKDQVVFEKVEMDYDRIQSYDIEFYHNNMEYSYEIDANTGQIISYEQDYK